MTWLTVEPGGTDPYWQVIPEDDLKEHELSPDCWCKPEVTEDDLCVHNSADGREDFETGKRKHS